MAENKSCPENRQPHFGIIPAWLSGLGLTGYEWRVLLVISCHARSKTRIARLSVETIADGVNCDRRTVQRAIRRLESRGILKSLCGGGRGFSSEYQILFEKGGADAAVCGQERAAFSDPKERHSRTKRAAAEATPTDSNRKKEQTPLIPPASGGGTRARERAREGIFVNGMDSRGRGRSRRSPLAQRWLSEVEKADE